MCPERFNVGSRKERIRAEDRGQATGIHNPTSRSF